MLNVLYDYERLCGIWPEKNRFKDIVKLTIHIGLMLYTLTGIILYMLNVMSDPKATISNITDALYTAQSSSNFSFNYVGCIVLRKTSLKFFKNVRNFDAFGIPATLKEADARINRNLKIIIGYCVTASITLNMYYLVTYNWCIRTHEKTGDIQFCGYICGIYYPYNYDRGISFAIHKAITTYTFTLLCFTGMLFICAGYCGIEYMVVKIEHLKVMLTEVLVIEDIELRLQRLKFCIKYHIHIIGLADELNECYSVINTPAIFFYSVTLGICFFSLAKKYTVKALLLIIGYIIGTFLLTMSGQKLIDKSESLGFTAYSMKWYDADLATRKYILFIIIRCQQPLLYKAGPFGTFSLPVFMNVIRGAYTYMSMQSNME